MTSTCFSKIFSKSTSCSFRLKHRDKMGLFEISETRELTLERLQLSSINPLLTMLV